MTRFITKTFLFVLFICGIDIVLGKVFEHMHQNAIGGYIYRYNYIQNKTSEDILIFGSSRASHHYNPQILSDALKMTSYNCGRDGYGILCFYGWWRIIKEHYMPQMIIYDITPIFDIEEGTDNRKYLGLLKDIYERDSISSIFNDVDPIERIKMQSQMYRYNSIFIQYITDYIHPIVSLSQNGFEPLEGNIDKMKLKKEIAKRDKFVLDTLKLKYLVKFVKETKDCGVNLIFVASPTWYGTDKKEYKSIKDICQQYHIPFYDYSNSINYVHHDEMFKDGVHLNSHGADKFTKDICNLLKYSIK